MFAALASFILNILISSTFIWWGVALLLTMKPHERLPKTFWAIFLIALGASGFFATITLLPF